MRATLCMCLLLACASARADYGDDSLGLNTHVPADELLDMCTDLGVQWIRVDGNWLDLEPSSGSYAWSNMDRIVDEARARGLSVYITLAYTPSWVPRVARARTDTYPGNDEPLASTEWTRFVEAAVAHYAARGVTHFGIWNEPNLDGFWEAGPTEYIDKILLPGAAAVHRACSSCRVLGPELAHVGDYHFFMQEVLSRAPAGTFDILAHHIYQDWPETGATALDGDNFLQALERRRFSFSRPALREVLDAHGWTGEVWITETGYRADPGDASDENLQAIFVRRVIEEQLARSWWTNSFFYEITDCGVDDPACPIDGFGITRPTRAGARSFPADYRLKPSYEAIRDLIDAHPEIGMDAPVAACGNGADDDGDGRADAADRGCLDVADRDEGDDPPRRRLESLSANAIVVDGGLADWGRDAFVDLGLDDWDGPTVYGSEVDVAARAGARWSPSDLWIAVEVTDDMQDNDRPDASLYEGDSIQIAFDPGLDRTTGYDGDDVELTFALVGGATRAYRFQGTGGTGWEAVVQRRGARTTYEIRLPSSVIPGATFREGAVLGFSILVNDADGAGREGWIELTPGIARSKEPYRFGELALVTVATPDAGVSDAGVARDGSNGGSIDGGSTPAAPAGCGCGAAGTSAHASWPLLALLLLGRRRSAQTAKRK